MESLRHSTLTLTTLNIEGPRLTKKARSLTQKARRLTQNPREAHAKCAEARQDGSEAYRREVSAIQSARNAGTRSRGRSVARWMRSDGAALTSMR